MIDGNIAKAILSVDEYTDDDIDATAPKPVQQLPISNISKQSILSQPWIRPEIEPNNTPRKTQSVQSPTYLIDGQSGDSNRNSDMPGPAPRA